MATDTEIAYIAGLIDGEGYIGVKKAKAYRSTKRATPGYHATIQIRMVDEPAIRFLAETLGGWYYRERERSTKGRPLFCYQASNARAELILSTVLPFLRVKRKQAETVLALREMQASARQHRTKVTGYRNFPNSHGTPRSVPNLALSDEYVARCEELWLRCKDMNRVGRRP